MDRRSALGPTRFLLIRELIPSLLLHSGWAAAAAQGIPDNPLDIDFGKWEIQLRKGSLPLAVLASLWNSELYGLEILRRLEQIANFTVAEGTIYPILNRLKTAGFIESDWVEAEAGHPRKYFRLTVSGRRYVIGLSGAWHEFARGMTQLLVPLEARVHRKRRAS
jgi:PadR family transcriptional regulator, regulatory protein PadR